MVTTIPTLKIVVNTKHCECLNMIMVDVPLSLGGATLNMIFSVTKSNCLAQY